MDYLLFYCCSSIFLWNIFPFAQLQSVSVRLLLNESSVVSEEFVDNFDYYHDDDDASSSSNDDSESLNCLEQSSIMSHLQSVYRENYDLPMVKQVPSLNYTMYVIDHLVNLTSSLLSIELSPNQLSTIIELLYSAQITDQCLVSLARTAKAIMEQKIWALKFVDALGKIPTGIAEGSISHFGEFDECLEIVEENGVGDSNVDAIRGQYCLAKFILPYPAVEDGRKVYSPLYARHHYDYLVSFLKHYHLDQYLTLSKLIQLLNNQRGVTLRLGVCFPSACSPEEFETLLNLLAYPVLKMPIELKPDCYPQRSDSHNDRYVYIAFSIWLMIFLVNILCTSVDLARIYTSAGTKTNDNNNSDDHVDKFVWGSQIIRCFSLIQNWNALFGRKQYCARNREHNDNVDDLVDNHHRHQKSQRRFVCIDAIRLILVVNVCVDHMFLFTPFMSFMSFKRILNSVITKVYYYNKYFFARNILIIDALFIISGLLLSYSLFRKLTLNRGRLQYGQFVIRLWLKYSLPMFMVMLLYWLLPLTGDGPIWNIGTSLVVPSCQDGNSLMSSFLYLSNYRIKANQNVFNFDTQFSVCNPPTWFLSALFQLQIIGPIFVYILYRNVHFGLMVNAVVVLLGCYAAISPDHLFGHRTYFDSLNFSSLEEMTNAIVVFHMGINQYIVSFFAGIIGGYLIHRQLMLGGFDARRSNRLPIISCWLVAIGSLSAVMYWFNTLHRINESPSRISVLLWFSLGKLIACMSISWMLYALCVGQAKIVEKLFSSRLVCVLSRLSFGIYLLHFIPLTHRLFTIRDTYVMTDKLLFEYIVIDFIYTAILATIFHLTIERPFNNVTSLLFKNDTIEQCCTSDECASQTSTNMDDSGVGVCLSQNPISVSVCVTSTVSSTTSDTISTSTSVSTTVINTTTISHHRIQTQSMPNVNLFTANCHEFYWVSKND